MPDRLKLEARLVAVLGDGEFTVGSLSGAEGLRQQAEEDLAAIGDGDPLAAGMSKAELDRATAIVAALVQHTERKGLAAPPALDLVPR